MTIRYQRFSLPNDRAIAVAFGSDSEAIAAGDSVLSVAAAVRSRTPGDERTLADYRRAADREALRVLAPIVPSKIVCIGLNYRQHAEEMGKKLPDEPLLFLKPPSSVIGPLDPILLPAQSSEVHFEGELALVIGRRARDVSISDALDHVLGWTIANDVTARDIQRREGKYTRAKGFDTFAPLGPQIVTDLDPATLSLETRVNGETRQRTRCDDLIFSVPELIAFVSAVMTLEPGDVISTGTPSGVGPLREGDTVTVEISELGTLENPVLARS